MCIRDGVHSLCEGGGAYLCVLLPVVPPNVVLESGVSIGRSVLHDVLCLAAPLVACELRDPETHCFVVGAQLPVIARMGELLVQETGFRSVA